MNLMIGGNQLISYIKISLFIFTLLTIGIFSNVTAFTHPGHGMITCYPCNPGELQEDYVRYIDCNVGGEQIQCEFLCKYRPFEICCEDTGGQHSDEECDDEIEVGIYSSKSRILAVASNAALSMATMSSEPKTPASGKIGILVKPKQSHTGVIWVARLICATLPGSKVDKTISVAIAQASWKAWKISARSARLPAGAICRQRPQALHCSGCK